MSFQDAIRLGGFRRTGMRLGFSGARVRLGGDSFEISFPDPLPLIVLGLTAVPFGATLLAYGFAWKLFAGVLALGLTSRVSLVVTRESSWVRRTVLGLPLWTRALGRGPRVENSGYSWNEIALISADPALRKGLHDDERAVLVEWQDGNALKDRDGTELIALIRAQVARLHPSSKA